MADDVGKTLTFSFDAKRGNINDPGDANVPDVDSTANAFIKTFVDPADLIDFRQEDTTAIPDTWNRYSVALGPIAADLVGATLQFGFSATASNYEPSQACSTTTSWWWSSRAEPFCVTAGRRLLEPSAPAPSP